MEETSNLFADDMISYLESVKKSTRNLLDLIKKFSTIARYKVNIHKSIVFLYSSTGKTENEIKKN